MMYSLVKSRIPAGRLSAQRLLLLLFFICRKWGSGLCVCVLLYFGTEYQNARSFEIILQIHLLIYLLDVIIYLFIELTLFVSYAFMFVTAGVRFVPNKPEITKKEVIIIRPFGGQTPRSNLFIRFQRSQQTSSKQTIFK